MMRYLILSLWLALHVPCIHSWETTSASDLETILGGKEAVVVAFVAPSEHKSQAIEAEWALAVPHAKLPVLAIDCMSQTEICKTYGVASYPSIKWFKNGVAESSYEGPRRSTAILAWIDRVQRPAVTNIEADSLTAFKIIDETVCIASLPSDSPALAQIFEEVTAQYVQEFSFGLLTDVAAQTAEELVAPAVRCYRASDGDTKTLKGLPSRDELDSFIKESSRPVIAELTPLNHQRFLDRGWPMVYVFALTELERTRLRYSLSKLARSQYESLTMVVADPRDFPELVSKLGLTASPSAELEASMFPAGAVHQLSKDRIYQYPRGQPVTPQALQQWGLDVWQGRVKVWTPPGQEPSPDTDTPGRIKTTRKVSMKNLGNLGNLPGVKIKIGGRDEL